MVTSSDICAAIKGKHSGEEWRVWFEVSQGTGMMSGRRADAVAMNIWPSKGYQLHCYEVKVSRSDFKVEMANLQKSVAVGKYCDFFWLATPVGLVNPSEVPDAWGLIELTKGGLRIKKQAPARSSPAPLDRAFAASLLRAGRDLTEEAIQKRVDERSQTAQAAMKEVLTKQFERPLEQQKARNDKLESWITAFEADFGTRPNLHTSPEKMAEMIRMAQHIHGPRLQELGRQARGLANMVEQIQNPQEG